MENLIKSKEESLKNQRERLSSIDKGKDNPQINEIQKSNETLAKNIQNICSEALKLVSNNYNEKLKTACANIIAGKRDGLSDITKLIF